MKSCIVITNGFYTNKSIENQVETMTFELSKLGVFVKKVDTSSVIVKFENGKTVSNLGQTDFILFLDKDYNISNGLENAGYRLFNSAKAIELCDDKGKTTLCLSKGGILMPKTISSPLKYTNVTDEFYKQIENEIEYPIVIKECYGSMGRNVQLAKDRNELITIRKQLENLPHIYQQFVGRGGEDIRVIVIGGKVVASMLRKNINDFRSNVELGGEGFKHSITKKEKAIAEKTAKLLKADYVGVDLLFDKDNIYVCEANSNAFYYKFSQTTGVNVAEIYAKYIFNKVYGK